MTAVLIPASLRLSNYCAVVMSRTAASLHIRSTLMGLKRRPLLWALLVALLVVCELGVVSLLYRHAFPFNCRAVAPEIFCGFMSEMVLRATSVLAAPLILIFARPPTLGPLIDGARSRSRSFGWLTVQVAGAGLIMAPWFFLKTAPDPPLVALGAGLWTAGRVFALSGPMLSRGAPAAWGGAVVSTCLLNHSGGSWIGAPESTIYSTLPTTSTLPFAGTSPTAIVLRPWHLAKYFTSAPSRPLYTEQPVTSARAPSHAPTWIRNAGASQSSSR